MELFENKELLFERLSRDGIIVFACFILVLLASLLDMWTGVDAARANSELISSSSLRKTFTKVLDYERIVLFGVLIDILGLLFSWYTLPYCAVLCTLGSILIEGKSVVENFRKKNSKAADVPGKAAEIAKKLKNK